MKKFAKVFLPVIAVVFLVVQYAQAKVMENVPVADIIKQAQTMTVPQIQGMIEKYKTAIADKKIDLEKVKAQLKQIPLTQMMGDKAKKVKDDILKINTSVKSLTDVLGAYTNVLNEKMKQK